MELNEDKNNIKKGTREGDLTKLEDVEAKYQKAISVYIALSELKDAYTSESRSVIDNMENELAKRKEHLDRLEKEHRCLKKKTI